MADELGCYAEPGSDLLECSLGDLGSAMGGEAVFALFVGGVLLTSFWVASDGGLATPAVLTILSGGLLIAALPPAYRSMALIVVFMGIVAAVLAGLRKYVSDLS